MSQPCAFRSAKENRPRSSVTAFSKAHMKSADSTTLTFASGRPSGPVNVPESEPEGVRRIVLSSPNA